MLKFYLCFFRALANAERLALQESYFTNMHQLCPYFVEVCFDRLKSVYVSPLELKHDVDFFFSCTVSIITCTQQCLQFFP